MTIEIYAVTPGECEPLFPTVTKLVAVAPYAKRDEVVKKIAELNKEAEVAGVKRRFRYNVTSLEIW